MPELARTAPPDAPPSNLVVRENRGPIDAKAWDAFVLAAGGSFLGTWRIVRINRLLSRVRVFEFFEPQADGPPRKVGQCAVAIARDRRRFLDRLHLVPDRRHLWDTCIGLVTARCGPGRYEYGSTWNAEERQPPVDRIAGLAPTPLRHHLFFIDFVDFSRWSSFAAYRRQVSENIRRDFQKAVAASAVVETRYGLAALRDVFTLVQLRAQVMARNQERFSAPLDVARHVLKLLCVGDRAFIATVRAEGRRPAAFFGVEFGEDVYYVAGGTEKTQNGYGSYLFMTLIERWMATHPNGKLFLGRQSACVDPSTYTQGNQLYRRKLRAQAVPGAAFEVAVTEPVHRRATIDALADVRS